MSNDHVFANASTTDELQAGHAVVTLPAHVHSIGLHNRPERAGFPSLPRVAQFMQSEVMFSDEQLKAIGCLALESTRLESIIDSIVEEFCGKTVADLLLKQKMFGSKLRILFDLVKNEIRSPELQARFNEMYSRISTDIDHRNTVIHGEWSIPGAPTLRELISALTYRNTDAVAKKGDKILKASEVMKIAQRFSEYHSEIVYLWIDIEKSLPRRPRA